MRLLLSKHIKTQLLTPDGTLFEGEATAIQVPGISGNFQILYNHAPLVSALGMGEIIIQSVESGDLHYAVLGGFIEVNQNLCTMEIPTLNRLNDNLTHPQCRYQWGVVIENLKVPGYSGNLYRCGFSFKKRTIRR